MDKHVAEETLDDLHPEFPGLAEARASVADRKGLLLTGPPGIAKTMLARRVAQSLPSLDEQPLAGLARHDRRELRINYVLAGLDLGDAYQVAEGRHERPFRAPHHTASAASMLGTHHHGKLPRPGEVALAHLGTLFLDDVTEFPRGTIETIRDVLERGHGAGGAPARPMLVVASAMPCPCGWFEYGTDVLGDIGRNCRCPDASIERHRKRLGEILPMLWGRRSADTARGRKAIECLGWRSARMTPFSLAQLTAWRKA